MGVLAAWSLLALEQGTELLRMQQSMQGSQQRAATLVGRTAVEGQMSAQLVTFRGEPPTSGSPDSKGVQCQKLTNCLGG